MIIEEDPEEQADRLADEGRLDEAIALLTEVARCGGHEELASLTALLREHGRTGEAEAHWRAAAAAGMPGAHGSLAELLHDAGRPDEALAEYRAGARAGEQWARLDLGRQLCRMQRLDEAMAEYRAMLADGDTRARVPLAKLLTGLGRHDEAIVLYRLAIDEDGETRWPLGAIYEKDGRLDEAIDAYRAAVDAGEDHVRSRLARVLAAAGRLAEATEEVGGWRGDQRFRQLGWLLTEQERYDELDRLGLRLKEEDNIMGLMSLISGAQRSARDHADCDPGSTCCAKVSPTLPG